MRKIWNKGHRIRASDKHLVYHFFHRDASVCIRGGSIAIEYKTAHAYRLGAFRLVRKRLDAFPLQLYNDTDSDWCLYIGRFSVLSLLLRQFQEAPTLSKSWQEWYWKIK